MIKNKKISQRGFGLVEVLVSISIISLVIVAFNQTAIYAYYNWEDARKKSVAYNILQSTIEDLRNRRDVNVNTADAATTWSSGVPFSVDGDYGSNGNDFPDVTVGSDVYTVKVNIVSIASTNVPGHTTDTSLRKKVTVTIGWAERVGNKNMSAVTYFTDWKGKY